MSSILIKIEELIAKDHLEKSASLHDELDIINSQNKLHATTIERLNKELKYFVDKYSEADNRANQLTIELDKCKTREQVLKDEILILSSNEIRIEGGPIIVQGIDDE